MKTAILIALTALTALMSGCAFQIQLGGPKPHLERSTSETIYQSLLAVDASQTMAIADNPQHYREVGAFKYIGGEHPSRAGVLASWATVSTLHSMASGWLSRQADATGSDAWALTYKAFQFVTIADIARGLYRNHQIGLRPFGTDGRVNQCCLDPSPSAVPESQRQWR